MTGPLKSRFHKTGMASKEGASTLRDTSFGGEVLRCVGREGTIFPRERSRTVRERNIRQTGPDNLRKESQSLPIAWLVQRVCRKRLKAASHRTRKSFLAMCRTVQLSHSLLAPRPEILKYGQ